VSGRRARSRCFLFGLSLRRLGGRARPADDGRVAALSLNPSVCAQHAGSSAAAQRTSPSASSPQTRFETTRRSRASALATSGRSQSSSRGALAIDGTKIAAAATHHANRSYEQIAQEIVEEAGRIDAAEDELYLRKRGYAVEELGAALVIEQLRR
jgi:hypothetical protein